MNHKAILTIIFLLNITFSQTPVCPLIGTAIDITSATSDTLNVKMQTIAAVSSAKWTNPSLNMTANIKISGWNSNNGSLMQLTVVVGG